MSTIAEQTSQEYLRIQSNRNVIRAKLVELNLATSTATLDALAIAISEIVNRGTVNANVKEGETYTIEPGFYAGGSVGGVAGGGNYALQEKTVTPTKKAATITSDAGYYGLSQVVINPIPENYQDVSDVTATAPDVLLGKVFVMADGTVKAGTMPNNGKLTKTLDANNISFSLSVGYYNGGTISITLEEKSVTPTKSEQVITPTTGKVLGKVTVAAIPEQYQDVTPVTANAGAVLEGHVFVDKSGNQINGLMANRGVVNHIIDGADANSYQIIIRPGYYDGEGTVKIVPETREVIPSEEWQTLRANEGKVMTEVTVAPIPYGYHDVRSVTVTPNDVLEGKTLITSQGIILNGIIPNNGTIELTFDPLTQSDVYVPMGYTSGGSVTMTDDLLNALKSI